MCAKTRFLVLCIAALALSFAVVLGTGSTVAGEDDGDAAASDATESSQNSAAYKDEEVRDPRLDLGASFVGTSTCVMCHPDKKSPWLKTAHALTLRKELPLDEQGCEMCHGAGSGHLENPENLVRFDQDTPLSYTSICLSCHDKRVATLAEWKRNPHYRAEKMWCNGCHELHEPAHSLLANDETHLCGGCHKQVISRFRASISKHPIFTSEDVSCTSCHNPHRGKGALLAERTVEETCARCHADRVGPFVFPHISEGTPGTESCLSCHSPHGTSNTNMLKMNGRGLCLSCHQDKITHRRGLTCWSAGCHTEIHGSNRNALFFPR